jgi:hypothetical protein
MHNAASVAASFDNVVGDREQQLVGMVSQSALAVLRLITSFELS